VIPTPGILDQTNDGLAPRVHMNMLKGDLLLSFATVSVKRLQESAIGAGEFVGLI
jgi:hypothetical protein